MVWSHPIIAALLVGPRIAFSMQERETFQKGEHLHLHLICLEILKTHLDTVLDKLF